MKRLGMLMGVTLACFPTPAVEPSAAPLDPLRVLTFNVWHGLRSGESRTRFPGEEPERKLRRFDWQIEEIKRLDPDLLLLQEVNRNQPEARRYAEALGYHEIHKVTGCGLHLPPIKIPTNVNEGLAILARPELRLRRVATKRLSGDARCTATFGFQTKESRYVLLGEIQVGERKLLVVTTHLSSPPYVPPGFEDELERLVGDGVVPARRRDEILATLERKRLRNQAETRKLLAQIARHRERAGASAVILGGDFNTEPDTPSIATVEAAGFHNVATGTEFLTWNPPANHVNFGVGSKRRPALPTFGIPELEALMAAREAAARQIDFIFVSDGLEPRSAEMVLDRALDGMLPSDHFGILAVIGDVSRSPGLGTFP